ncbi:tyrosine-type recombinase/integrase [Sulfurospirillum sp. 1307]
MKLQNIAKQYFLSARIIQADKTYRTNKGNYFNHIESFISKDLKMDKPLGEMNIQDIKYSHLQSLINNILHVKGLSPKTAKNILTVISKIFQIAIRDEIIDRNPCLFVEIPKFDNKRYFTYGVEIQKEFLKSILIHDEPIYSDMLLFLFHGRRLNEVLSMKWEYIDFETRTYQVPAQINKARKNDTHTMTDLLFDRLYKYYLHAVIDQNTKFPKGYVFINPLTKEKFADLKRPWARFLDKFDLPKIRLHDIRHLIGTYSINVLNQPIEKISHTLGHTDIKITQRYITKKPNSSKEIIDSIFESVS